MDIVTHISRSGIDDTQSEVTTSVFVPKGDAPEGGFPIVALSNRTTGIAPECAPSLSPTLLGLARTNHRGVVEGTIRGGGSGLPGFGQAFR